ncbi:MAG: hypothetical protein HS128_23115 [Ideonella sp.]|nr:hypothetical protein [Ideonella sp.]MCC7457259.1 hypothetical protein [Nitrospira sp.]
MDALQQLWHLSNLLWPPLAWAALHAAACKLLWRRALTALSWLRLAAWCSLAAEAVSLAGLAWTGHDGAMATYGAMALALAATTWLVAFAPWSARTG